MKKEKALEQVCGMLSISVLHPDSFWYRLDGMGAQKSSCNIFSIDISRKN